MSTGKKRGQKNKSRLEAGEDITVNFVQQFSKMELVELFDSGSESSDAICPPSVDWYIQIIGGYRFIVMVVIVGLT